MTENKAGKESLTMRKQSYVIIGIGLAALVGIFRLAQFDSKQETETAAKPTSPSEETTVDSETEKPVDPFAGMRNQSSSEVEPLSEEDKELMAKLDAFDKKEDAYQNSPRGNYLETTQDFSELEDWMDMPPELAAATRKRSEEQVAKYNALDAQRQSRSRPGGLDFPPKNQTKQRAL